MDGVVAAIVAVLVAGSAITACRVPSWPAPDACLLAGCAAGTPPARCNQHLDSLLESLDDLFEKSQVRGERPSRGTRADRIAGRYRSE